jgi:hypothetical protein
MTQERTISINYNDTVNLEAERAARRQALVYASTMQLLAKCSNVTSEANLFPPPCYPIKNCHLPHLKATRPPNPYHHPIFYYTTTRLHGRDCGGNVYVIAL